LYKHLCLLFSLNDDEKEETEEGSETEEEDNM
jgi:hypothetical protein